jgi:hypothetical protein
VITKIERIARCLDKRGPMTSAELAEVLGITLHQVTDAVKVPRSREKFGIYCVRRAEPANKLGAKPNVWAIDSKKLALQLAIHGESKAPQREYKKSKRTVKKPVPREPKRDFTRKAPVYTGPMLTVWQKCSPYSKDFYG